MVVANIEIPHVPWQGAWHIAATVDSCRLIHLIVQGGDCDGRIPVCHTKDLAADPRHDDQQIELRRGKGFTHASVSVAVVELSDSVVDVSDSVVSSPALLLLLLPLLLLILLLLLGVVTGVSVVGSCVVTVEEVSGVSVVVSGVVNETLLLLLLPLLGVVTGVSVVVSGVVTVVEGSGVSGVVSGVVNEMLLLLLLPLPVDVRVTMVEGVGVVPGVVTVAVRLLFLADVVLKLRARSSKTGIAQLWPARASVKSLASHILISAWLA